MNKPIIGIVSNRNDGEEGRIFTKTTNFSNLVAEKIYSSNGIPVGLLFPYGVYNEEMLKQFDGFVLQGGNKIELCQLLTVGYAIKNNKPILGICNGMQTMAGFEYLTQKVDFDSKDFTSRISKIYDKIGEDAFLKVVIGHNENDPFYIENIDESKHSVYFDKDSFFYDYYNSYVINAVSVHYYACKDYIFNNSNIFKVAGVSSDGVIEAIENKYGNSLALGVQYHIEMDDQGNPIFNDLVNEAQYVRKYRK